MRGCVHAKTKACQTGQDDWMGIALDRIEQGDAAKGLAQGKGPLFKKTKIVEIKGRVLEPMPTDEPEQVRKVVHALSPSRNCVYRFT